jgi:hypothetical protein
LASAVVVVLVRHRHRALASAWLQLMGGPWHQPKVAGLRKARVMGSGRQGGFGLTPSLHTQGWIGCFDTLDHARAFAVDPGQPHAILSQQRSQAALNEHGQPECFVAVLETTSSRGQWGGMTLHPTATLLPDAPMAVITRASIRPTKALDFWRHSPATERSLASQPGCRLAMGMGEAPLLRQLTFSVWDNQEAMQRFAHQGAHREAGQAAWQRGWFSEWLFARFVVRDLQGTWKGFQA